MFTTAVSDCNRPAPVPILQWRCWYRPVFGILRSGLTTKGLARSNYSSAPTSITYSLVTKEWRGLSEKLNVKSDLAIMGLKLERNLHNNYDFFQTVAD